MSRPFHPRCAAPAELVEPVASDPAGVTGPTPGQSRGPGWRRTSPGLYVPASTSRSPEQRAFEQSRRLPPGGAVGGWAALRLHGAAYFDGVEHLDRPGSPGGWCDPGRTRGLVPVPLAVPRGLNLRPTTDSVVSRCAVPERDVVVRHGVPCLVAERALAEVAAASADLRAAVTALDMGFFARVTTSDQVRAHLGRRPGLRGAALVRQALDLAEDRVLSPQETWLRLVWVLDAGLPRPRCNWPVADLDGRRLGRPDLLGQEIGLAAEYDGAEHRTRARHGQDVRREADFRAAGLEVVTVVATDRAHPGRVVARLLEAAARVQASRRPRGWLLATHPGRL